MARYKFYIVLYCIVLCQHRPRPRVLTVENSHLFRQSRDAVHGDKEQTLSASCVAF